MGNRVFCITHSVRLLALGLMMACVGTVHAQTQHLDRVVAIVDEDVVMESELNARVAAILDRVRASNQAGQLPPMDVLETQILDQLIYERLQLMQGERFEIRVTDSQVDQAIQNILRNNQLTQEQLARELAQQGTSFEDFRRDIRRDLTVNQIQQAIVNSRIRVSEQDVNSFLASTDGRFATSPDYRLGHILIAVSGNADQDTVREAEQQARGIVEELREGADFGQMAMTYSNDQNTALSGGDLGWRKLGQLPELFSNAVEGLSVGQITEPFRSGAGFHILKNLEQRGGGEQLVTQTRARHILIEVTEIVSDEDAQARLQELRRRVEEDGADFAELAREHSQDIGSRMGGGDLGWAAPGSFVPAFEEAMAASDIGEIAGPFRSQFGWHILKVDDRREQDMSREMMRNQAAQMLRQRRFDEELQTWISELRDNAYIEIKR
ncbi:peptidylprolyl isomerase [Marinimicrobium alkaliphilum]|uniref:peptidylprolyl isomerase n=1 Tax=Marinimicrobium alkaliphilum TaxID=2202654 RepID=UPI000DBA216A|nr:peptidylprolyl isomerase [Marinimicrobium alkaliphilum]